MTPSRPNPLHPSPLPTKTPSFFPLFQLPKSLLFQTTSLTRPLTLLRATRPETLPHSAIQRIADKLRSLGFSEPEDKPLPQNDSAGEIFIPLPNQLSKHRVGHTLDPSWSTPENPVPSPGSGNAIVRYNEMRAEAKEEKWRWKREKDREGKEAAAPTLAELSLSKEERRRLITAGIRETRKFKIGKAGVTEGVVNGIHERWRRSEVVKIVCEDLCRFNMKRTHDLLERKTGGLVVWRSGSKIILYRGDNYKYPYFSLDKVNETSPVNDHMDVKRVEEMHSTSGGESGVNAAELNQIKRNLTASLIQGVGSRNRVRFVLPGEAQLAEQADSLLEGLGPRFTDWWGCEPFPVDADLLPAVVPGYRKPFRLLPYGVRPKLTDDEMTSLKRLGRPLPAHFALGRNKKLQGLAASIVKLWEKCEIAKIAIKRGVQNTNSEMMANELKWLTGGTLLSRDREFIVLYRGKDFLPSAASAAIEEKRKQGIHRFKQLVDRKESEKELVDEAQNSGSEPKLEDTNGQKLDIMEQKKLKSIEAAVKSTSVKLSMSLEKKAKAEKLLKELEEAEAAQQPEIDKEGISEEERYMLRKVGLKMKPFLLLGRRGVFDGTVENMHLHWKYRELVKVICQEKSLESAQNAASILEAESGGILVAVERVNKGYAIIVYRGKNYTRPARLRPSTLLTKKQAMKRSLEAQRLKSLKLHVLKLNRNINNLKLQLMQDKESHNMQMFGESQHEAEEGPSNVASDAPQSDDHSDVVVASQGTDILEAADKHDADSLHDNMHDSVDALPDTAQYSVQIDPSDCSSVLDGDETGTSKPASLSELGPKETHERQFSDTYGAIDSVFCPDNFMSEERNISMVKHFASPSKEIRSKATSAYNDQEMSGLRQLEENYQIQSRPVQLTNKERLLLRRQALKMRKRPVLAVGRSNVVTGVAKTIKAHFEKYPLAIVNVKGRAKRTSVQEIVFKLEQATGGVLVSQEPSKVILYRGWGADLEPGRKHKRNTHDPSKMRTDSEGRVQRAVSAELLAAIRRECGLQNEEKEQNSSGTS